MTPISSCSHQFYITSVVLAVIVNRNDWQRRWNFQLANQRVFSFLPALRTGKIANSIAATNPFNRQISRRLIEYTKLSGSYSITYSKWFAEPFWAFSIAELFVRLSKKFLECIAFMLPFCGAATHKGGGCGNKKNIDLTNRIIRGSNKFFLKLILLQVSAALFWLSQR